MFLSKSFIKDLILKQDLITGFSNLEQQLTANGFDLRVAAFVEVLEGGALAVEKKNNVAPKLGRAFVLSGFEDRLQGYDITERIIMAGSVSLKKLQPYLVITCEKVNIPKNMMVFVASRTSLFRLAQTACVNGFSEAGYEGFWAFMLMPFLDTKIELGARFAQAAFAELKGESHYDEQKEKSYQGGKLF